MQIPDTAKHDIRKPWRDFEDDVAREIADLKARIGDAVAGLTDVSNLIDALEDDPDEAYVRIKRTAIAELAGLGVAHEDLADIFAEFERGLRLAKAMFRHFGCGDEP